MRRLSVSAPSQSSPQKASLQDWRAKLLRGPLRYVLAFGSLIIPAVMTEVFLSHPKLSPLMSFSYVLAVAIAAWVAGFWGGVLVIAASSPMLVIIATHGKVFLPPALDIPATAVMLLIALLSSRVAAAGRRVEEILRSANDDLGRRVAERTADLAQARESLRITLASIGDAVIATDTQGVVTLINPLAQQLTGWNEEEAIGQPLEKVFSILSEETRTTSESPVTKVLRSGLTVGLANHTILLNRGGREVPIDDCGAPIKDDSGGVTGVVLVFRDVTERRRARHQLEDSERRYRILFEDNPQPMWVHDPQTLRFLEVNRAAVEAYGYTREEFLAMAVRDIRPKRDPAVLPGDGELDGEAGGPSQHRKKDGSVMSVETVVHRVDFNRREARLALVTDVTERRLLQEQLRQAQKMESVGRLAGGIAHDFNNLLTVINGYTEMTLLDLPEQSPPALALREVALAGQRAADLTRGLLAFSRRQVFESTVLNLNDVVRGMEGMLRRLIGEDIETASRLDADVWQVSADRGQLEQVVMNLAVNARDAMPDGGILTIETSNLILDSDYARTHLGTEPGAYVLLAVSDTGHGMDSATRSKIFEPFFTTKGPGKGTGLGLATVYGIVKQSGGSISVYSEVGTGTVFKIYLPRYQGSKKKRTADTPSLAAPKHGGSEAILLVEDEDSLRALTSSILERSGFRVFPARSGAEALAICRRESENLQLVLTDMVMPQMSGHQLATEIKRLFPDMRFLFMSGYTEHTIINTISADPNAFFVSKPFSSADLVKKVREAIDAKASVEGHGD